ncbi:unnamed protein product [Cuscuta europaea]|uniref:RRM domain-containing protein n=2 Tax=Cuscuta europaea TaxID=41803 RepID=A0A9P1DZW1_CUSEU|nr:unnamed protein product [Cuscuta europaea]
MSQSTEHLQTDHKNHVKGSEVFIGGLARTVTEEKIREAFFVCGKIVEIRLVQDKSGNLKGFGFLRFATKEAAEKAVKERSGYEIDGKKIGVLPSVEQDTLFFGNLNKGWSADEFENLIHQVFPDVVSVNLVTHGDLQPGQKQRNRGFGFVKFSSHAAAARAYRFGSNTEFLLGNLHPAIQWAEDESEIDKKELAKIKIAFVRNLPLEADENYLRELFERFGKVERVVLSRKGNTLVGFVHFDTRLDLENAIKELNEKTVQGPNRGQPFKLQVEVARPMDKSRKRSREESENKCFIKVQNNSKPLKEGPKAVDVFTTHKSIAQLGEGVEVSDSYEAAIVALPAVVNERLLRIMRLGIATKYDITVRSLTRLRDLPESTVISILDQFMLSGSDVQNKAAYLDGLISKYAMDGKNWIPSSVSRVEALKEPETWRYSKQGCPPADDLYGQRVASPASRSGLYVDHYSPTFSHQPLLRRLEEASLPPIQHIRSTTSAGYGRVRPTIYSVDETTSPLNLHGSPPSSTTYGRVLATLDGAEEASAHRQVAYGRTVGLESYYTNAADRRPTRSQVRFDPFTGEPYKFDPFTGEPILPESSSRHF